MTGGTTVYCGDNCNHTGPHNYPPTPRTAADPRLDALLADLRKMVGKGAGHDHPDSSFCLPHSCAGWWQGRLRDALAAFDD